MNVGVRPARVEDHQAFYDISNCPGVVRNTLHLPYVSLDVRKDRLANPRPGEHQLVAEVDGRVVGMIGIRCGTNRMSHSAGLGMSVHDDFQGQGIGAKLMAAAVDLAEGWLNIRRIELHVFTDNEPAIALYKKFGFEIEGTHRAFALREGQYVDAYSMARLKQTL